MRYVNGESHCEALAVAISMTKKKAKKKPHQLHRVSEAKSLNFCIHYQARAWKLVKWCLTPFFNLDKVACPH